MDLKSDASWWWHPCHCHSLLEVLLGQRIAFHGGTRSQWPATLGVCDCSLNTHLLIRSDT